jgi:hypothetical protein
MRITVEGGRARTRPVDDRPRDLMSRYREYVERTAESARTTRDVYDGLLGRVAAGELDPKSLDRGLNHFLQSRGPEYASAIFELSVRFLAGVVDAGQRATCECVQEIAPEAVEMPLVAPPAFAAEAREEWLPQLLDFAARVRAAQTTTLRALIDRSGGGDLDGDTVERAGGGSGADDVPDGIARLADLYFDLLSGLDEANADFGIDYLRTVERHHLRPDAIDLDGAAGTPVDVRFVVSNHEPVATAVQCSMTDVRREDGVGPAFEPTVVITPEAFDLAPHADAEVACSILLSDAFHPDATYVGDLRVTTGSEALLRIPVRLRVTAGVAP